MGELCVGAPFAMMQLGTETRICGALSLASRFDDAARAGWLYYVAGRTQDEIAAAMSISRQSAQRLVSLAVSERLVKVRLDHPIAQCLELAANRKSNAGCALPSLS
jgi:DNA-binding transcriptional regulator LsrR (DeoR family)